MPQPDLGFTPDSSFPVTYAEKGSIRVKIKKHESHIIIIISMHNCNVDSLVLWFATMVII